MMSTQTNKKLGAILFELPPSFTINDFNNIEQFLNPVPTTSSGYDHAVEFRHRSSGTKGPLNTFIASRHTLSLEMLKTKFVGFGLTLLLASTISSILILGGYIQHSYAQQQQQSNNSSKNSNNSATNNELANQMYIIKSISGQGTNSNNSNSFLTYENSTYGIRIQYPSDWVYKGHNSSFPVQSVVTFARLNSVNQSIEEARKSPPVLTIAVQTIPVYNLSLDTFTRFNLEYLRQNEPGFELIQSNSTTLTGNIQAHEIVFIAAGLKTMAIFTLKNDKAYIIEYIAGVATPTFSNYLPTVQRMIQSFQLLNPTVTAASKTTTATPTTSAATPRVSNITQSSTNQTSVNTAAPTASGISNFEAAKNQYLSTWNQSTFHSGFDTFIQEGSATGYGVYVTHPTVFKPGDSMVLYVEPVGYGFKQVLDAQGNTLNQINLTAIIAITGSNGTQLFSTKDIPVGLINSHNKNTEMFVTLKVDQSTPFPVGDYKITYTINDGTGKSFQLVKTVKVANFVTAG